MKARTKSARGILTLLTIVVLTSAFVFAQTETGQIVGTVTDPSGAVVPNVNVTLTNVDKGIHLNTTSSGSGVYRFTNLQPGTYEVGISQSGFATFKQRIEVTVGSRNTADAALKVTGQGTTVEVTAEGGAQVNTTDQTLSSVVTGAQITQLPTLTRDPYDLVATGGNVAQFATSDPNTTVRGANGYAINGQRPASTDILLDGGENVNLFDATVGQSVPLDSVQEFRVLTSNFTAEYGRASGGVVNVATRSGTNDFHGTLYEFNRISNLAANNYENKANGEPRGRFVRNQPGYSIGGPIVKNKVFFFSSTEWTRVRSNELQRAVIPTPAFIAASSTATQAFFSQFGTLAPNATVTQTFTKSDLANPDIAGITGGAAFGALAPTTPIFEQVSYSVPSNAGGGDPQNAWSTVGRVDFNITDHTQLYARYGGEKGELFAGTVSNSPYAGYNTGQTTFNNNIMLNMTHTFGGFVSQTKGVFNRLNLNQPLGTNPVSPTLYIQETTVGEIGGQQVGMPGYLPFSPGNALPFGGPQNLYQVYQDLGWTKGNHNFRIGGQYIHTRDNRVFGAYETAVASLASQGDLDTAVENFLSGNLFSFQAAVDPQGKLPCPVDVNNKVVQTPSCTLTLPVTPPSFSRNNRYNDWAAYGQDSWKVTPRLTLNLGLRYEYYGPQHNANPNLDSNFYYGTGTTLPEKIRTGQVFTVPNSPIQSLWEPDRNNWAPRLGFAWDVFGTGKTSFRGGYGISYERNFGNVTYNVIQNPPAYAVISLVAGADVPTIPLTTDNAGPLAGTGTKPLPRTSLRNVKQDINTAYAHFYSAAFEQQLGTNTVLALEYSGSRGIHLYTIENPNRPGSGVIYGGDDPAISGLRSRLNRQYTNINRRGDAGDSYYNGLNVRVQSSTFAAAGLTLTANYTWSHTIDTLSSTFSETSNNFNLGLLDPFNPGLDRGNSEFDIRHRVAFSAVWEIPAFRNSAGPLRQIFGGWSFAPIFTAQTGTPFSIYDCTNAFQVCMRVQTNLPLQTTGNGNPALAGTPNTFNYLPIPQDQVGVYTNSVVGISDFGVCNAGTTTPCVFPANMTARNAFRGPGRYNLDFGLYKSFKLTEKVGLQFRGEAFDALNHANLYVLGTTADAASGTFVQAKRGGITGNDTREHRNVQLGVKITF
ncbi:MAG: TonB-dependent receptor [Acidobacteriales bacterium]|nr:TonB-dependent receptor [Terriglobales bacterium]